MTKNRYRETSPRKLSLEWWPEVQAAFQILKPVLAYITKDYCLPLLIYQNVLITTISAKNQRVKINSSYHNKNMNMWGKHSTLKSHNLKVLKH